MTDNSKKIYDLLKNGNREEILSDLKKDQNRIHFYEYNKDSETGE